MWNRLLSLNLLQAGNHCNHCKQRSALITIIFISKYYFLLCTRVYSQYDFSRSRQNKKGCKISISSVQSLSCVRLFVTPWTAAHQASLSITNSRSLRNLMSIELVMPSNRLILCCPFSSCLQSFPASGSFPVSQLFASGSQSTGVSASASVLPRNIQDWFPLGLNGLISLQSKGFSRVISNTTVQKHQFFGAQPSLWSNSHIHTWLLENP